MRLLCNGQDSSRFLSAFSTYLHRSRCQIDLRIRRAIFTLSRSEHPRPSPLPIPWVELITTAVASKTLVYQQTEYQYARLWLDRGWQSRLSLDTREMSWLRKSDSSRYMDNACSQNTSFGITHEKWPALVRSMILLGWEHIDRLVLFRFDREAWRRRLSTALRVAHSISCHLVCRIVLRVRGLIHDDGDMEYTHS